jgi:hypothetical protein
LVSIHFRNTTKTGTGLSDVTETFDATKVLFVGWEVSFKNRLFSLDSNQYRVDAAYVAPDGRTLGSVDDIKTVSDKARSASFSGRIGNSSGGAFLPGIYTVNFYLNGQYFAQKKFRVIANGGLAASPDPGVTTASASASAAATSFDSPALATGQIEGLGGKDTLPMEVRLRPQPNGFLHGELLIHDASASTSPIDGFIRGDHIEFQVPYGHDTLYFEGERHRQKLSGSFSSEPSGTRGNWNAHID